LLIFGKCYAGAPNYNVPTQEYQSASFPIVLSIDMNLASITLSRVKSHFALRMDVTFEGTRNMRNQVKNSINVKK
jgi:hypothetical protein